MTKSAEWICNEYLNLKAGCSKQHNEFAKILKCYTGGMDVVLPELDDNEKPAVANLLAIGGDQLAMRVASVMPMTMAPPIRPGFQGSEAKAESRRKAVDGWNQMDHIPQKMRRRSRHLVFYGSSPVSISPVSEGGDCRRIPFTRVRNPMTAYPSRMHDHDNIEPDYCIFIDTRTRRWLEECFPEPMGRLRKSTMQSFDVLEYVDCEETTLVVVGSNEERTDRSGYKEPRIVDGAAPYIVLASSPNRTGICPVVMPGRITLGGRGGQFTGMIGMYEQAAMLNALLMIQTKRDVFPDQWVESIPNSPSKPNIVEYADGLTNTIGIVHNGRITQLPTVQNQAAQLALDSLERAQRMTGDIPAEWQGESGSNIRTARRGADVLSSATEQPIQEYQEIFELSFEAEYRRRIAVMKTYYGREPSMFFIPASGKITRADYTPNDVFETDQVYAKYPMPGMDFQSMTVQIGQMIGDGTLSAQTGMERDPRIEDPHEEMRRVYLEGLRRTIQQQLASQPLDPHKVALIAIELANPDLTFEEAVDRVEQKLKKEQAAVERGQQTPAGTPPQEAAQPGLDQTPEAAALAKQTALGQTSGVAGRATVPPPSAGSADLMSLLQKIHPPAPQAQNAA